MKIELITDGNTDLVRAFVARIGDSAKGFRYFSSRPIDVISRHVLTLVGLDESGEPVCYGHLDPEDGVVWLGICVAEGHKGQGLGRQMMNELIARAERADIPQIDLSVDDDNVNAIRLYESCGFLLTESKSGRSYYRRVRSG